MLHVLVLAAMSISTVIRHTLDKIALLQYAVGCVSGVRRIAPEKVAACKTKPEQGVNGEAVASPFVPRPSTSPPLWGVVHRAFGPAAARLPSVTLPIRFTHIPQSMSAPASIDCSKRRNVGPAPIAVADLRTYTVSARFNLVELCTLDTMRSLVKMQRGEFLRAASLHVLPPTIPPVNKEAWLALARANSNLNQLSAFCNSMQNGAASLVQIGDIHIVLTEFRNALIAALKTSSFDAEDDE